VVYAWITIFVAILAAFEKWPQETPVFTRFKILKWIWCAGEYVQKKKSCKRAKKLLEPLADIQAVTGIAILISAWAQGCAITFYHQELVLNYWTLTIISFWAARPAFFVKARPSEAPETSEPRPNTAGQRQKPPSHILYRRVIALLDVCLGAAFHAWVTLRENENWDNNVAGQCYHSTDQSDDVPSLGSFFFVAILTFYALTLFLVIIWERKLPNYVNVVCNYVQRELLDFVHTAWGTVRSGPMQQFPLFGQFWAFLGRASSLVWLGVSAVLFVLTWFISQVLGFWSYSNLSTPFSLLVYVALNVWVTHDIIGLKGINEDLIIKPPNGDPNTRFAFGQVCPKESLKVQFGFGQVLPLIMMSQLVYNIIDVWNEEGEVSPFPRRLSVLTSGKMQIPN
jgi:hypothetical protein